MTKIVGIRFRTAGKIYYFDPADFDLDMAMHVIVETARGIEMGTVLIPPKEVEDDKVVSPLKPVIRVATEEDEQTVARNKEKEKEAFAICKEKIIKHGLEMKLVDAEYTFDSNKLLFYFTADGRIDFRELVKDLAAVFRTRIELRQIGVRDETKMMGGIGICGRPLCCSTYMPDFVPVSIKMAKEQNLSLNPTKISGVCGRLMCCLKYEQETYEYLNSRLPSVGEKVKTPEGIIGEVKSVSVLRQLVRVVIDNGDEKELREYTVDDLRLKPRQRKDVKLTEEEIKELKGLEDTEDEILEEKPQKNRGRRDNRDNRGKRQYRKENQREDEPVNTDTTVENTQENTDSLYTQSVENGSDEQQPRSYRERRNNYEESDERENSGEYRGKNHQKNYNGGYNKNYKGKNGKGGKPYKGKYNRNKDYKKNYNKDYNRDYNKDYNDDPQ
ncbi:PSP1 domain-containing protein [Agathobacter sp.]